MADGTIISAVASERPPRANVVSYELPSLAADSTNTELISIEIPGWATDSTGGSLEGSLEVMGFVSIAFSSDSEDLTLSILNKNDILLLNESFLVYKKASANLYSLEQVDRLVRNRDTIRDNKLYVYMVNADAVNATGVVQLELTFFLYD